MTVKAELVDSDFTSNKSHAIRSAEGQSLSPQ